jgi:hypothetical protein
LALIGTFTFILMTSQGVRRLWPRRGLRIRLGIAIAVGAAVIPVLATSTQRDKALLVLGVLALLGLLGTWVILVPKWLAPPLPKSILDQLPAAERVEKADARLKLQNDLRTTALQAIAGLAVLAGAVVGFQQLGEDRQQAAADRELTRQGQASERFTRAIAQLGSDRREV